MARTLHLDDSRPHAFWDKSLAPRLTIEPGDTVVFETLEGTGQVEPGAPSGVLGQLDDRLVHPLTGPVYVEGAEPGDTLQVEVLALEHKGWGWNGVIPNFGLLPEDFPEPYIHHYELVDDRCEFGHGIVVPYRPFCGVMGVSPREAGRINTAPPRENAGNIDIRHLTPGSTLFLPVLVPGALFSCGDCHAAQGDGEVNGTGIETPMAVTLRLLVRKEARARGLHFLTRRGESLGATDEDGYFATSAHGPDLLACAREAVSAMIEHLCDEQGLTPEQAYCLCGAAVDLRISEIVNLPNYLVSAYLPLGLFSPG